MGEIILDIQHISLSRNGAKILTDVRLSINRGESLVIIGPSGSGKSSLLRCINRLEAVESGQILFNDVDISAFSVLHLRRQIGMVFQKAAVFDGTVSNNISFGPRLIGRTLSQAAIANLMEQVALESNLMNRNAHELSGGQEQRLAIARALANQPDILLLDEPTSALDPIATHKIERTLQKLCSEKGLTLIWVSHSIEQARRVADRVLLLEAGQVSRLDTVAALLDADHGDPHTLAFAQGMEDI